MRDDKRPGLVTVTLELPLEVAEFLAKHGDEQLHALKLIIAATRQEIRHIDFEAEENARRQDIEARLAELTRLGGSIYWVFQERLAARGQSLGGLQRRALRQELLYELADENGIEIGRAEVALSLYRRRLDPTFRTHRDVQILRLAAEGIGDQEIAARVRVTRQAVTRRIAKFRAKAASEGLSLAALADAWISRGVGRE
jgi:hypothetical protein